MDAGELHKFITSPGNLSAIAGGGPNDGDDIIDGGGGKDSISGQGGSDTLTGGDEEDTFVYSEGDGDGGAVNVSLADVITDFLVGTDKIDLTSFVLSGFGDARLVIGDPDGDSDPSTGDASIAVDSELLATLTNVNQEDLTATEFVFA